jgi:hypothetical protein
MDSLRYVPLPPLSALNRPELEALLTEVLGEVSALKQTVAGLREEIARLKGLKGRPDIKPSGMESGTGPLGATQGRKATWSGQGHAAAQDREKGDQYRGAATIGVQGT